VVSPVRGRLGDAYSPVLWYVQAEAPTKKAVPAPPAVQGSAARPLQAPEARGMMSQAEIDAIHAFMTRRVRACFPYLYIVAIIQHSVTGMAYTGGRAAD